MDKEINKEYQPLIAYLTEIMQKLQNQSDVLRGKDIKICLRDDKEYTDNACVTATAGVIGFGKNICKSKLPKAKTMLRAPLHMNCRILSIKQNTKLTDTAITRKMKFLPITTA